MKRVYKSGITCFDIEQIKHDEVMQDEFDMNSHLDDQFKAHDELIIQSNNTQFHSHKKPLSRVHSESDMSLSAGGNGHLFKNSGFNPTQVYEGDRFINFRGLQDSEKFKTKVELFKIDQIQI
jgi:hypothetical protein